MAISRRDALLVTAGLPASALAVGAARAAAQAPAADPRSMGKDPLLAACLLIGGRKQIENCRFALTKLTNDECKAFARAEIAEHEGIKSDLQKLGFAYPVTAAPQPPVLPAGGAPPATGAWVVASGRVPLSADAASLIAVDHEVADQCIANYRREMSKLSGLKLDKRFVGHQLDEHLVLLDKAQTFRRHASPAMAPTLDQGLKVIETHISTLKTLMDKLDEPRGDR